MKNKMDISVSGAVTTIRMDDPRKGFEQWFLLMSDNHRDSIYCNRDLETEHLEEAKRRSAGVFIFGDFFDAMLDPTADANTILSISLPIASNFTAASDCVGTGKIIANNTTGNGSVYADATNDLALLRFAQSGTTSNTAIVYHFTYLIK